MGNKTINVSEITKERFIQKKITSSVLKGKELTEEEFMNMLLDKWKAKK